jgi:hypothetical protein
MGARKIHCKDEQWFFLLTWPASTMPPTRRSLPRSIFYGGAIYAGQRLENRRFCAAAGNKRYKGGVKL